MSHFTVEVAEDPKLGKDPIHRAGLSMYALEGRVDYMGSSILMARLSDMTLTLRDEWKIDKIQDIDAPLATTRFVLWDTCFRCLSDLTKYFRLRLCICYCCVGFTFFSCWFYLFISLRCYLSLTGSFVKSFLLLIDVSKNCWRSDTECGYQS